MSRWIDSYAMCLECSESEVHGGYCDMEGCYIDDDYRGVEVEE